MSDDELRELAEEALKDDRANCGGEWDESWGGTIGRTHVYAGRRGAPKDLHVTILRREMDTVPEGKWMATARYREPQLARAVLRLLKERAPLEAVAEVAIASDDHSRAEVDRLAEELAELRSEVATNTRGGAVKIVMRKEDDFDDLVEADGRPRIAGVMRLWDLVDDIKAVLVGHLDNTNAPCRIGLRGHDCCYTCNAVEDMLRATLEYFDEFQKEMRRERKGIP